MQISFGDGAFDAYVRTAETLPPGYIVALLDDGEGLPETQYNVLGTDVKLVSVDHDGVRFLLIDQEGEVLPDQEEPQLRTWERIARIHVY